MIDSGPDRVTGADWETYEALLLKWQRSINLVSPSTLPDLKTRHFLDSAQLIDVCPDARVWVDLGSGAGFPGLVVALLLKGREGACVHLVESDTRKAAFLRTVSRETGAPVKVHADRLEKVLAELLLPGAQVPQVISARALASLSILLGWTAPFLLKGAVGLFLKGQDVDRELTEIPNPSMFKIDKIPSRTDLRGCIVKVTIPQPAVPLATSEVPQ